jgi:hypothetical protein
MMGPAGLEPMGRRTVAAENAERRKRAEAEARPSEEIAARERLVGLAEHGECFRRWVGCRGPTSFHFRSIDVDKLVGVEQRQAKLDPDLGGRMLR